MPRPVIFGEWSPDTAFYNQRVLVEARGVIPDVSGYRPFPSFRAESSVLPSRVRGGMMARANDGTLATIVGTDSGLYRYDQNSNTWSDISDATYSSNYETFWSMAQFGNYLVMTNYLDAPRVIDVTDPSATTVSVLGGSPPKARHVCVVKDHLVFGALDSNEAKVHWSAINDITGWTIGTNLSDVQEFPDGGRIMAMHGGEYGYILQERKIRMMIPAPGSPEIFQFQVIADNIGCAAPRASVSVGGIIFFLAPDGFYVLSGQSIKPISDEKVWRWFQTEAAHSLITRIVCGFDAKNKLVIWGFISNSASAADIDNYVCDRLLCYHWPSGRWTYSTERVTTFIDANLGKLTLEQLDAFGDLDSLPFSLDSAAYNSDRTMSVMRVFDENHRMGQLDGDNQEAFFELKNVHFNPPQRALVRGVMPITDAQDAEVAVAAKERIADAANYGGYVAIGSNGFSPQHSSGRVHDIRIRIPAASQWTHIQGMYVDAIEDGDL